MPRMSRQTELIKEPKSKVRGVELAKSTRTGSSLPRRRTAVCYEVSPEIRSVREGRIRPGSVAPLLSRRAKALAMKSHYDHYSDDEEDDVSDNSDESSSTEIDYDDELYDDHHHRSYGHHRIPIRVKKDYDDEYEDEIAPPSYHISTSLGRTRPQPKSTRIPKPITRASVAAKAVPTKSTASAAKSTKSVAHRNLKNKNKKSEATLSKVSRSGPITRSRGYV